MGINSEGGTGYKILSAVKMESCPPPQSMEFDLSKVVREEMQAQIRNMDFEKTVHLGTKIGNFLEYLRSYSVEVKDWKNYYNDQDVLKGEEIHLCEQGYASKTLDDVENYFMDLFQDYIYPQENDDGKN